MPQHLRAFHVWRHPGRPTLMFQGICPIIARSFQAAPTTIKINTSGRFIKVALIITGTQHFPNLSGASVASVFLHQVTHNPSIPSPGAKKPGLPQKESVWPQLLSKNNSWFTWKKWGPPEKGTSIPSWYHQSLQGAGDSAGGGVTAFAGGRQVAGLAGLWWAPAQRGDVHKLPATSRGPGKLAALDRIVKNLIRFDLAVGLHLSNLMLRKSVPPCNIRS